MSKAKVKRKTKKKAVKKESVMGRPTKYQAKYCDMLKEHMATGGSFFSFGAVISVDQATLYRWVESHDDFCEAKSIGELMSLKFYEDYAKAHMTGQLRRVKREIIKPDGSVEKEYIHVRGDSRTLGIVMRSRFRKFGYANHLELTGKGGGALRVKDVSELTDEEIEKELAELDKMVSK